MFSQLSNIDKELVSKKVFNSTLNQTHPSYNRPIPSSIITSMNHFVLLHSKQVWPKPIELVHFQPVSFPNPLSRENGVNRARLEVGRKRSSSSRISANFRFSMARSRLLLRLESSRFRVALNRGNLRSAASLDACQPSNGQKTKTSACVRFRATSAQVGRHSRVSCEVKLKKIQAGGERKRERGRRRMAQGQLFRGVHEMCLRPLPFRHAL